MDQDAALRLLVALGIGLLVGVERGWQEREAEAGSRTAGIRTYSLLGLLGGIAATIAKLYQSPLVFALCFLGTGAVFAWFKYAESRHDSDFSVTGVIAALLVFALGGYAILGDLVVAAGGGVITAMLLASREILHGWLRRLTWVELRSALLLLAMTVLVLPVLPDRAIDPYGGFNPRQIWFFTVLAASLSFVGYVATKVAGTRSGIVTTGLAGGLVSSTIVSVTLARRSREDNDLRVLPAGALLAAMVSALRVSAEVLIVQPSLFVFLIGPLAAAALVFGGWALALLWKSEDAKDHETSLTNPFEPKSVLLLGLFMGVVAFVSAWIAQNLPPQGLYGLAAVTGLADVDALTLSTARLAGQSLTNSVATTAILIGVAVNGLVRAGFGFFFGSKRFAFHMAAATAAAIVAGAIAAVVILPRLP